MFTRASALGFISTALILILFTSTPAKGPTCPPFSPYETDLANPIITNRVHRTSNVWMNITNWGCIGNDSPASSGAMEDPEYPGTWAPQCEFPAGSGVEYLYMGTIWIGALIQEEGYEFPRVSVGRDGWYNPMIQELFPGEGESNGIVERSNVPGALNYLGEQIYSPDAVASQEFIATYTDTLTESFWVRDDPIDGPHRPLGIKVRQKSMVWNAFGFDDFVMFEYDVQNIGTDTLKDVYLGWFIDADIGWIGELPDWHQDDLSGFLGEYHGDTCNIAYSNDNDGRPYSVSSGNDFTSPGVAGTYILQPPESIAHLSFNWWVSNVNPSLDFGPCWQAYADSVGWEWMMFYGTPMGDLHKYQVMSNREIDYDQVRTDQPSWISSHPQQFFNEQGQLIEEQPWATPNASDPNDIANGYDTRYLVSWGPLGENVAPPGEEPETYLFPGDSLKLVLAYVCADSFHDPTNPQTSNEVIDPSKYVYDHLVYNASKAQFLFDHDFLMLPPYAPHDFRITLSSDDFIRLEWDAYSTMPGTLVDIYRKTEGSEYGDTPINGAPISGTAYEDHVLTLGARYYYKAQGVRYDSLKSYFSNEVTIIAGAPLPPTGLMAESSLNGYVPLSWNPNAEPDLNHYNVYRADSAGAFQIIGSSSQPDYTDHNVTNGIEYAYAVTALDDNNYESDLSGSATATPMGFYEDLIVVMYLNDGGLLEWHSDSLMVYYDNLFADIDEEPNFVYLEDNEPFPTLSDLSPYATLWMMDDTRMNRSGYVEHRRLRDETIQTYIDLGGNVVVSGRRLLNGDFGMHTGYNSSADLGILLNNYFAIDEANAASWPPIDTIGFIAAEPTIAGYPYLDLDSTKFDLLEGPSESYTIEIDGLVPAPLGESFYTYVANYPDSSEFQGMATAVRYDSTTAIITFPLYAMEPYESVMTLAENALRYVRGQHFQGVDDRTPEPAVPEKFALYQNYPNPFNPTTIISFDLPMSSRVKITVYNILGQRVATLLDARMDAGTHRVIFDAKILASGVYFYILKAGDFSSARKMVLLK
jgi:hypothetical protein